MHLLKCLHFGLAVHVLILLLCDVWKKICGRSFVGLIRPPAFHIRFSYRWGKITPFSVFILNDVVTWYVVQDWITWQHEANPFFTNCSVSVAEDITSLVQSDDLCYGVPSRPSLELVLGQMKQSTSSHVTYRSFATTVSQLKICDFSGEIFKGFEEL